MPIVRRWCAKGNQTACSNDREKRGKAKMSLQLLGHIELPGNLKPGGFDHAAVHCGSGRLYVAHTANDALAVFGWAEDRYLPSLPTLTGVSGALCSRVQSLVSSPTR